MGHQDRAELFAHVHSAAFMGLGYTEMPHIVMPLNQDETILVVLRLSKLDIAPLQGNQFALPKPRSKGRKEQRVIIRTDIHAGVEKSLRFLCCHRLCLALAALSLVKFADLGSRVAVDQFVLYGSAQDRSKSRKN